MANQHVRGQRSADASSNAAPRPRILRIGVLLGDTFIEERLIRERTTVSVGQSHKNTFTIPVEGLPKSFPLFALRDGQYYLNFTKRMTGRLAVGGKPRTLESLRDREAKREGDHYSMPMESNARGKIEIGEMRLLFQFVAAPPLQPRPRLPASVRGTLADRIDPRLAIILGISILIHFAVALYAYNHDQTMDRRAERLQKEFRADIYTPPDEVVFVPTETAGETTTEETGGGTTAPDKVVTNKGSTEPDDSSGGDDNSSAPDDAAIQEAIANSAFMSILGGGEDGAGRYSKGSDIDQGAGLDKGLDDVKNSGKGVSGRGSSGDGRTRGPNTGEIGGEKGGGQITGPKGGGDSGEKGETKITSRADLTSISDLSDGELDPNSVIKKIKSSYLRGIKACHERGLKTNPKLGGRVNLRFTVGASGKVTSATAKGFDSTVDACIQGLMTKWRFGAPKDQDGKPSSASFSVPVVLKPGG